METQIILKPDAIERGLQTEIFARFQRANFRLISNRVVEPSHSKALKHCSRSEQELTAWGIDALRYCNEHCASSLRLYGSHSPKKIGETILKRLITYYTSGPILIAILENDNALNLSRKLIGHMFPEKAKRGTIRGDLCNYTSFEYIEKGLACKNLIHAASSEEQLRLEIETWQS